MKPPLLRSSGGAVLVMVALALTALLALAAIAIDWGYIFLAKSELQNAADSAVLAALKDIYDDDLSRATQSALGVGGAHSVAGSPIEIHEDDVVFGFYDRETLQFTPSPSSIKNAVYVTARREEGSLSGPLTLFLGSILGMEATDVKAASLGFVDGRIIGVRENSRLIPYSVDQSVVDQDGNGEFDLGVIIELYPVHHAPGAFGFVDFDGGSGGIPELRDWIENGYDEEFMIPLEGFIPVPGSPGITGLSLLDSFFSILGEYAFMPVHNQTAGAGANVIYQVVTFLAVRILDVNLVGNPAERSITAEIIPYVSSTLITSEDGNENNSLFRPRLVS